MTTRMLRILIAVVLMMGTVVSGARADSDKDKSEEKPVETIEDLPRDARMALFEAQQHLEKGETDKAVEGLGKYVQSHDKKDDSFLVRYQYATMLVQADRRDEAMKQYQRVVELEPRYDEGWLGLGETAYGLGDYTRAANALKQGYDLSTEKRPELLYYAAAARLQSGDAAGALPWLEELASGDHPKFEWYRGLVSACLQADDKDRGQHAVDAMLDRFPNNADAWYLAFQFYASTTNYPKAAGSLTVVGYLRPLTRTEHLQLGDLYSAIDNPAAAADQYAIATRDSASTNEVERVASAYMASYQPDRALVVLNKTLTEEPSFKLWSLLGDLQVVEKRFHEAYKAFSVCVGLSPDEPRPHLMLGYCALELNQPDLAMTHLSVAAGSEEYAERAQMLIQRAQIMRSTPSSEADQSAAAAPPSLSGN